MAKLETTMRKLTTITECSMYMEEYTKGQSTTAISFLKIDCGIDIRWKRNNNNGIEFRYIEYEIGYCGDKDASWIIERTAEVCTEEERQTILDKVNYIRDTEMQAHIIKSQATANSSIQIHNQLLGIASNLNENTNQNTVNVDIDTTFEQLLKVTQSIENKDDKKAILQAIKDMQKSVNKPNFLEKYSNFLNLITTHVSIYKDLLPVLASMI